MASCVDFHTQHTHKTVWLHLKIKYNNTKIKNLKILKSVNLSPVNQERVFPVGYPLFLCLGMPLCLGFIDLVWLWLLVVPPW